MATSLRRVEMLFMGPPSGDALDRSMAVAECEEPHAQGTREGVSVQWGELPMAIAMTRRRVPCLRCVSCLRSVSYFQNISIPPPTISTPKPTARFQSPIGSGSWPAEM